MLEIIGLVKKAAQRLRLGAILNSLFVLITLVWITGGWNYRGEIAGRRVGLEVSQLDLWVLGFLAVLLIWRWSGRSLRDLWCIRILEAAWTWIVGKGPAFVYAFALWSALLFTGVSLLRHLSFHSSFDLAIFSQAYWNSIQGDFLYSSLKGGINLWGDHLNPIVLGILPFYRAWSSPEILLVIQGFALAAGALPLYALARKELGDPKIDVLLPIAYLLYLPLRRVNLHDFHPIALATPLILAAFYFLRNDRYVRFMGFALLAGLCKETGPVSFGLLGAYCLFAKRKRALGALMVLTAVAWFLLNVHVIIPRLNPGGYGAYWGRYAYLGDGLGEKLLTLLTRPGYVLMSNSSIKELLYPLRIFVPVGFLPFLTPAGLLTLPYLLINLLESSDVQVTLLHHQAELTAFVFIATVYGAKRILETERRLPFFGGIHRPLRGMALAGVLVAGTFLQFGRPESHRLRRYWPARHAQVVRRALSLIPPSASVSAQAAIAPHLANRRRLFFFPTLGSSEYVLIDYQLDRSPTTHTFDRWVQRFRGLGYRQIFEKDGVVLFRSFTNEKSARSGS